MAIAGAVRNGCAIAVADRRGDCHRLGKAGWQNEMVALVAGVVGLGNMGLGMAASLVRAGLAVSGFDLAAARCELARAAGVRVDGPVLAPVVVLSLPSASAVTVAVETFLQSAPAGAVLVDTSTLDVAVTRRLAARVAASGRYFLDAPVSGGPAGAVAGTLTMMVGGHAGALETARPVLQHFAARIVHVGGSGAGQVAKLANNLLLGAHMVAAAEVMRMVSAAGVAEEAVLAVMNAASGRSAVTEVNLPRWILSGAFDSGFTAALMRKDVGLAMDLLRESGVAAPVLARAAETWLAHSLGVAGDADFNRVAAGVMEGGHG
jgi:3-hydroxyisobutyrate dehydrogenase